MFSTALVALDLSPAERPIIDRSVRLEGNASQEITRYTETHDVSLIVVGKHGRGRLADKLIGSTAAQLCEVAGRPVLMVP